METAETFIREHAHHVLPFKNVSKKNFFSKNCSWFHCESHNHNKCDEINLQYFTVNGSFYCTTCKILETSSTEFILRHASHVVAFNQKVTKKDVSKCNWNYCQSKSHQDCNEKNLSYFHYKGKYICTLCKVTIESSDEFIQKHSNHVNAFSVSKQLLFESINNIKPEPQQPVRSSSSSSIMKRKREQKLLQQFKPPRINKSLKGAYSEITYDMQPHDFTSVLDIITKYEDDIDRQLGDILVNSNFKVQFCIHCSFVKQVQHEDDEISTTSKDWHISNKALPYTDSFLRDGAIQLDEKIANYSALASNYSIDRILLISFIVIRTNPLSSTTGRSYLETPTDLASKKAIINVKNYDNLCFLYSILVIMLKDRTDIKHKERVSQYTKYLTELKYDQNDMPMKISNVAKFERQNPQLAINVLKWNNFVTRRGEEEEEDEVCENDKIDILYRSSKMSAEHICNLLVIENSTSYHYTAIINLQRLLNTGNTIKRIWCERCLRSFHINGQTYAQHIPLCESHLKNPCPYQMPERGETVTFTDWHKTIPVSHLIYADFESILLDRQDHQNTIQTHMPIAAGMLLTSGLCCDIMEHAVMPTTYESFYGDNCIFEFLQCIERKAIDFHEWHKTLPIPSIIPHDIPKIGKCYMCKKSDIAVVRDHCHYTGTYLGPACNTCNLARRIRPFLPVLFHNLRRYDLHHVLKHAISRLPHWSLSVIPQSTETFLSLTAYIGSQGIIVRFLDSLQFLSMSLDSVVLSIPSDELTLSKTAFSNDLCTKGVFPYSYVSSHNILELKRDQLPPIEVFHDKLQDRVSITPEQYAEACEKWNTYGCETLKDYMMVYLKRDVYLLADVFQHLRRKTLTIDGLEPAHFYSIPGLSWASALKMTNNQVDLLYDSCMYEFFESGLRGGMTFINKHMCKQENNTELLYLDINNLYGWALSQMLPCNSFQWCLDREFLAQLVKDLLLMDTENCDIGYVFEVDLAIPNSLHDQFDQLPLAPELKCPPGIKTRKLLLTHEAKHNYVIHFRLLKTFLSLGVEVTKIHRAVSFRQERIFEKYICTNTENRAKATTQFERQFFKLKNNSLYGKTVENVRGRKNIRLCQTAKRLITYSSKVNFHKAVQIDDNLVAAILKREGVFLNKPIYIGQAVLDLSKMRMYDFYYQELQSYARQWSGEINIAACDTDSYFLEIKNIPLHALTQSMMHDGLLDTSNYPPNHLLFSNKNASKVGLCKDESEAKVTYIEWVFLRPKCYSLLTQECQNSMRKAKGVQQCVVKNRLCHEDYRNQLNPQVAPLPVKVRRIGSINHQLYTFEQSKIALSSLDDKRHWTDWNDSLAYGHYRLGYATSAILYTFITLFIVNFRIIEKQPPQQQEEEEDPS